MIHAYAAAKAYSGMTLAEFDAYVKAYAQQSANGFSGMTYGQSFFKPVLSFGNSGGDCAMHNYALSNPKYKSAAFMLIADDDARDHANRDKALKLGDQWRENGYHVISMRDDFKTIYGDGVVKTDFTFPTSVR